MLSRAGISPITRLIDIASATATAIARRSTAYSTKAGRP